MAHPASQTGLARGLQPTEVKVEPGDWHSPISLRPDGWQALDSMAAVPGGCAIPSKDCSIFSDIPLNYLLYVLFEAKMYCQTFQHI